MNSDRRISIVLLLLRLSVFLVMLMWTLDKFVNPDHAAAIFQNFYLIGGLSNVPIYIIGGIQLIIILGFVAGFQKRWTYLLVLFFHSVSTFSSFRQYFAPFENLLFFAAWPMLAACFALYYLRDLDIIWTVDKN
ncbi:hypothetical protein [Coleofasciculus sp. E1-EBD-02]|uniref:hypothetical protein n=1 Tax=Coleofasciculus sp. E1-EBD-02 TaxID=3068481 RepID=UPI0032F497BC